jgi:hypothetical protein
MIEIQDTGGMSHLLNIDAFIEVSPAPGAASTETRVVLRNGAEYRVALPYASFRARLRTLLDRMLPLDREVSA